MQALDDGVQRIQGAGVYQVDSRAHQHQVTYLRPTGDQLADAVFQIAGIGEIQALVDTQRQHAGSLDHGEAFDVAKMLATRYLADHGDMWLAGAPVGQTMKSAMPDIRDYRKAIGDAYSFNWALHIEPEFQLPFEPTHENMAQLNLSREQPPEQLACNLRKAFSGIVAGNVKDRGIKAIEQYGPFKLSGDASLMHMMDKLLQDFIAQKRMKLPGSTYVPCYEIQL